MTVAPLPLHECLQHMLLCICSAKPVVHVGGQLLQQLYSVYLQWRLPASGVSHGNMMPSVGQSRLPGVYTEQSTRIGKTLSKMVSYQLVASITVLMLVPTNNVHLHILRTTILLHVMLSASMTDFFPVCTARLACALKIWNVHKSSCNWHGQSRD